MREQNEIHETEKGGCKKVQQHLAPCAHLKPACVGLTDIIIDSEIDAKNKRYIHSS